MYLCEMDMLLHDHWKDPRRAEERLEWYAERLRELFGSARDRSRCQLYYYFRSRDDARERAL